MAYNIYKGMRYVPKFYDDGVGGSQHTDTVTYEPLTIVMDSGNSYTSKTYVPIGIAITNTTYWAETGNYNAQVEAYREEVTTYTETFTTSLTERMISVTDYGAIGDGSTDDTVAIQDAIDAMVTAGGGIVFLPTGTFMVSEPLLIYSKVKLKGTGKFSTLIKAMDNATLDAVIKTWNFDTLTGNDIWFVSEGIVYDIGMEDLQINGNATNSALCYGIKWFAKKLNVRSIIITDCAYDGWLSEGGAKAGQPSGIVDLPESHLYDVTTSRNGLTGFRYKGPHDASINTLFSNENGEDGVRFELLDDVNSASCDVGLIHTYANDRYGFYSNQGMRIRELISENSAKDGIILDNWYIQIDMIKTYKNCKTGGNAILNMTSNCQYAMLGQVQILNSGYDCNALLIDGANNTIGELLCRGDSDNIINTGVGVTMNSTAPRTIIGNCQIMGYTTGLYTNADGTSSGNQIKGIIRNCTTLFNNGSGGTFNKYNLYLYATELSGQVLFDGASASGGQNEVYEIHGIDSDGNHRHSEFNISGGNVTLNSTGIKNVTINHKLFDTPKISAVKATLNYQGSLTDFVIGGIWVDSVDDTNVYIKVLVTTASATAATAKVNMSVKYN